MHVGEFGCFTTADGASRAHYYQAFREAAEQAGDRLGHLGLEGRLPLLERESRTPRARHAAGPLRQGRSGLSPLTSNAGHVCQLTNMALITYVAPRLAKKLISVNSSSSSSASASNPEKNRLAGETSPYLLQHATNPVDWYPWGPEALEKARSENKPIFLSIGYSACHWCHVMEHESFENPEIAALMNEHFVNIKVDREERPDLDQIYMSAVMAMTGHGGWPMSVFLTPECKPFFGGTYFPPTDSRGMAGFPRVLLSVHRAWEERHEEIAESAHEMTEQLRAFGTISQGRRPARLQAARPGGANPDAKLRPDSRRLWPGPEVSPPDGSSRAAAASSANRRRPGPSRRASHAREDGAGRNLRSPGRRLRPLFHRRTLARAPLRKNALRQRPV